MTTARESGRLDVDQALKGFLQDPDWMFKIGVGGTIYAVCLVLGLASPFCAPVVFALLALTNGYLLRIARYKVLDRDSKLPPWDNWMELFISGLTWLAIQFGFLLLILSVFTVSLLIGAASGAIKMYSPQFLPWALISLSLTALVVAVVSFFNRFLMVNFAVEERIKAGFALVDTFRRAAKRPGDFLSVWLLTIGFHWAAVLLPTLTLIGIFLIPSAYFISEILAVMLAAQVWQEDKMTTC